MMIGEGGANILTLNDFSGGFADFPLNQPNRSKMTDNFLITAEKKLRVRSGGSLLDPSQDADKYLWPNGRTCGLFYTRISGDDNLFVHSSEKIIKLDSALIELQAFNGRDALQSTASVIGSDSYCAFGVNNDTVYAVAHEPLGDTNSFVTPRKIYRLSNGAYETVNGGMPRLQNFQTVDLFSSAKALAEQLQEKLYNHIQDVNGNDHTASSLVPGTVVVVSLEDLITLTRNLRLAYQTHVYGTVHTIGGFNTSAIGNSGGTNITFDIRPLGRLITAADCVRVLNELRLCYRSHIRDVSYVDSDNFAFIHPVTAPSFVDDVTLPMVEEFPGFNFGELSTSGWVPICGVVIPGVLETMRSGTKGHANSSTHTDVSGYEFADSSGSEKGLYYVVNGAEFNPYNTFEATIYGFFHLSLFFEKHRADHGGTLTGYTANPLISSPFYYPDYESATVMQAVFDHLWKIVKLGGWYQQHVAAPHGAATAPFYSSYTKAVAERGDYAFYYANEYETFGGFQVLDAGPVFYKTILPVFVEVDITGSIQNGRLENAIRNITSVTEIDNWPTSTMKLVLARKDALSQLYYIVDEAPYPGTGLLDRLDADALVLQDDLYTNDGSQSNDPPPKAATFHIVNNIGYYGHTVEFELGEEVIRPTRIRQSIQNDIDSCPASFYKDAPSKVILLGSAGNIPIACCEEGIYRIEGIINPDGSGGMELVEIDKTVGVSAPLGGCPVGNLFIFAANDGVYSTDGYRATKLSGHIPVTYGRITALDAEGYSKARLIKASYNQVENRVYFTAARDSDTEDGLLVLDLEQGMNSFTYLTGMFPSAVAHWKNQYLVRGDKDGFVFIHSEATLADEEVDRSAKKSAGYSKPIEYNYLSAIHDFGTSSLRKYITTFSFVLRDVAEQDSFKLSCTPYFVNDKDRVTGYCRELEYSSSTDGFIMQKRHFPAGNLRCLYKQVGFLPATRIVGSSDTSSLGYLNPISKTLTLDTGASFPPTAVGKYLYLDEDGYTKAYEVTTLSMDLSTVVVADPDGTLPELGSYEWTIEGVPTDERMEIISVDVPYEVFSRTLGRNIPGGHNL